MQGIEGRVIECVAGFVRDGRAVTLDSIVRDVVGDSFDLIELLAGLELEFKMTFDNTSQALMQTTGRVRDLVDIVQRVAA